LAGKKAIYDRAGFLSDREVFPNGIPDAPNCQLNGLTCELIPSGYLTQPIVSTPAAKVGVPQQWVVGNGFRLIASLGLFLERGSLHEQVISKHLE
jgi:hypothetical protein